MAITFTSTCLGVGRILERPLSGALNSCMHPHALRYLRKMSTTLQIRSVDNEFAAAAKAEAARRRMSLSDYLKELIREDLARNSAEQRRAELYDEIARTAPTGVDRAATTAALAQTREDMGLG